MVAADVVPIVDMSLPEAEAARVLKVAAVTSGFFYGELSSRGHDYEGSHLHALR